jgi:predicted MFS family arabinose efflux permease
MTLQSPSEPVASQPLATSLVAPPGHAALLLSLGAATFMVALDGRVIAPLLPTIAADFSISVASASWLVSGYMLPYGMCQLAYGPLADRVGKVRVATYAMAAFSIGTALCGAFPSFATIVVLRALTGAAAAALIPLTIAYIGDTVPYERRQAALGMLMASAGAAQAFSTSAGGAIAALVSWRSVFPILGALAAVATLFLFSYRRRELRIVVDPTAPRPGYGDALRAPRMKPLLALAAFEAFLYIGGFSFLSGLLEQRFELDPFHIGLVMGVAGVAQLLSAQLLPLLLRRISERGLLQLGGTAMGAAYVLSAIAPSALLVALACALLGVGFSLCHTTLQTRASEAFPRARSIALGLFAFSLFSGGALGTVCLGYASELLGYGVTFALAGLLFWLFTAIVVSVLGRRSAASDR